MRLTKSVTLTLAALFLAGAALAQRGPRPDGERAPRLDALGSYLQLSDQQAADLKALQSQLREQLQPLMEQIEPKARALREETRKESPNSQLVEQLRNEIRAIRDQMDAKRSEFTTKSRNALNATQLSSLEALQKALSLQAAAHEAVFLNLIDPPEGVREGGPPRRFARGPRGN